MAVFTYYSCVAKAVSLEIFFGYAQSSRPLPAYSSDFKLTFSKIFPF